MENANQRPSSPIQGIPLSAFNTNFGLNFLHHGVCRDLPVKPGSRSVGTYVRQKLTNLPPKLQVVECQPKCSRFEMETGASLYCRNKEAADRMVGAVRGPLKPFAGK